MGTEIERKFLLRDDSWRASADAGLLIRQGYLSTDPERSVRIRRTGSRGLLTIKGASEGATRSEFDFEIDEEQADELLDTLCLRPLIEKTRYRIAHGGRTWEVDEFAGVNAGLVLAEIELSSEGELFDLPDWAGQEVTEDPRYYNASLVSHPFAVW
jgi:adenylate cyclase